jgi:hypothetical protein
MPFENFHVFFFKKTIFLLLLYVGLDPTQPSGLGRNGSSLTQSGWVDKQRNNVFFFGVGVGLDPAQPSELG